MTFWKWSRVAGSNGNADTSVNYLEGQAPSTLNDAGRAVMAAAAKYRDDMAGAIVTGGSVNAYTVFSYQGFDSLAHLDGNVIAFSPHVTSTGACQISIDGLGLKPLRPSPGVDFLGGELIQGTPYTALYNNATGEAYVRGYSLSPFNLPFLAGADYWDTVSPASCYIFPQGQAINRATYSKAFARWGTKYGVGDGSTTFNVPDVTGRVRAMVEAASTRLTTAVAGIDGATIGAAGGSQSHTLTLAEIPAHSHANTLTDPGHAHNFGLGGDAAGGSAVTSGRTGTAGTTTTNTTGITINNVNAGSGNAHAIVQPTIVCNYIIRVF